MGTFKNIEIPRDINSKDIFSLQDSLILRFDDLEKEFEAFEQQTFEIIKKAEKVMLNKIGSDPVLMEEDLSDCTTYSYTIGSYILEANSYLDYYKIVYFKGKTKDFSEADRDLYIDSKTFRQRRLLNKLKILESKIDKKVGVMQSILRYETSRIIKEK